MDKEEAEALKQQEYEARGTLLLRWLPADSLPGEAGATAASGRGAGGAQPAKAREEGVQLIVGELAWLPNLTPSCRTSGKAPRRRRLLPARLVALLLGLRRRAAMRRKRAGRLTSQTAL